MDVQKGYYGDKKFTCILGLSGSAKTVQYIPNRDFKDTSNVVAYLAPGVDMTATRPPLPRWSPPT